jgi:hypothetical protein
MGVDWRMGGVICLMQDGQGMKNKTIQNEIIVRMIIAVRRSNKG